jgi:predicted alpha/beta hydrolase family esterase
MSDYCPTLIVPGLHGSAAGHWQTWWQQKDRNALRVEQADWSTPDLDAWQGQVRAAVLAADNEVWIVAHSFGCLASLCVAQEYSGKIAGLFLVAPADPDKFGVVDQLPKVLDVPSLFVGSHSDPWLAFDKAQRWSKTLGSQFIDLGNAGHINIESGFGAWQQGVDLFGQFKREVVASRICC